MGGPGSGRWRGAAKAIAVEECFALDVRDLKPDEMRVWPQPTRRRLIWRDAVDGRVLLTARHERKRSATGDGAFEFHYEIDGELVRLAIGIQTTSPYFGGKRLWLSCPLAVGGLVCNRRVVKLYLPPGGRYFGCRRCHQLTYRSCQESDKRLTALRRNPRALAAALTGEDPYRKILALKAVRRW